MTKPAIFILFRYNEDGEFVSVQRFNSKGAVTSKLNYLENDAHRFKSEEYIERFYNDHFIRYIPFDNPTQYRDIPPRYWKTDSKRI